MRDALVSRQLKLLWMFALSSLILGVAPPSFHGTPAYGADQIFGTALGEIEARPGPVSRRMCVAGPAAGALCKSDAECPGSSCTSSNVFNVSVNLTGSLSDSEVMRVMTESSKLLFDLTDGQARFGRVTVFKNASTDRGYIWLKGSGNCAAYAGTWGFKSNRNIQAPVSVMDLSPTCITHEFMHATFDILDEYRGRGPNCGSVIEDIGLQCPVNGGDVCIMSSFGSPKLCWGQATALSIVNGNHDVDHATEQSICRNDRSCANQIAWAWPSTMNAPAEIAPSGTYEDPTFNWPGAEKRAVLVLDRSGSMNSEGRLTWLRLAALNVVETAENGEELGIVSYSNGASVDVDLAPLGWDRSEYISAIDGLTASGNTNIGAGLQAAYDAIVGSGSITGQTGLILMTDGINNRPAGNAAADLEQKLTLLLMNDVPVSVICRGEEAGLDEQCSAIAARTNSDYASESSGAYLMPIDFMRFYESLVGRNLAHREAVILSPPKTKFVTSSLVDKGARSATFIVQISSPNTKVQFSVVSPSGKIFTGKAITQGSFLRLFKPEPGKWRIVVESTGAGNSNALLQVFVENPKVAFPVSLRKSSVKANEPFTVCLRPILDDPLKNVVISGRVLLPDGKTVREVNVTDLGGGLNVTGDDLRSDGMYCGLFKETSQVGPYNFLFEADVRLAEPLAVETDDKFHGKAVQTFPFVRYAQISGVVTNKE